MSNWSGASFMKLVKEDKEIWIHLVGHQPNEWMLYIVQKEGMAQDIVANAEVFSERYQGKPATQRSTASTSTPASPAIKSESAQAALPEIAKLLKRQILD